MMNAYKKWCETESVTLSRDLGAQEMGDAICKLLLGCRGGDTLSIETTEVSDYDGERTGILLTKVSPNSDESEPEVAS